MVPKLKTVYITHTSPSKLPKWPVVAVDVVLDGGAPRL